MLILISKSNESLASSCFAHELILSVDILIAMESNTAFYILESRSTHHFVKLLLAVLRCDNQEATIEVLQITKLCDRVLNVSRMLYFKEAIGHIALIEPNDIHGPCPVCQILV